MGGVHARSVISGEENLPPHDMWGGGLGGAAVPDTRPGNTTRQWRLGTSLLVSLALLLALLMSFTFLTYRSVLAERRDAEIENAAAMARTVAAEVDRFIHDLQTTTLAIATILGNEGIPLDQPSLGNYLGRIVQDYGFIRALFVTDLNGHVLASASGEGIGLDLSDRPYMEALFTGTPAVWSDSLSGIQSGQVTVAFGRPIPSRGGAVRAYLLTAFYPRSLVARLQSTLPDDSRITLVDRHGFVMHSTYLPEISPEQRDVSSFEPLRNALAGRTVILNGDGLPISKEPRFGAIVPVSTTKWAVVYTRPLEPLEARIRRPAIEQAALLTVAVVLVGLIFGFIARRLTRPLSTLADTAAAIARGERPHIPDVTGVIETSQLAAGMRSMAEAVAQREDRLQAALDGERASREAAERAQTRLQFLTEASSVLAASLDYEETLRNVAQLAVPSFADWCSVDVVDDEGKVERLAVAHVDPKKVDLAYEINRRYPPDPSGGVFRVVRTGEPMVVPHVTEEMLRAAARDDAHARILRELGLVSAIMAPFKSRSGVLGAISFVWAESNRRYTDEDVALALDLARRAAVAIENAHLYRRERGIAETLQRSLLRRTMPEFPGMTIASRYLPARQETEIGGDWYDAMALPDGRIALVMGDVAGRGIEAAAIMGQLQNAVRAYALEGHPPAVIMDRVARLLDIREMATLVYVAFDPAAWTLSYANAGHLPPLVVGPRGHVHLLEGGGPPLGSAGEIVFHEQTAALTPGSTILLYTDGLVEVRGEPLDEGLSRLLRTAAEGRSDDPAALLEHLVGSLLGAGAGPDDVALLALHAAPLDPVHLRLRLNAVPSSMPLLRHTLRRWLVPAQLAPAEVFDITVAASEAFSNAIEHAYPAADAQVEVEGTLDGGDVNIRVRDWGQWRQPRGANRGRGLGLMRGLMTEVRVEPGPTGTTVYLRKRVQREVTA